MLDGTNASITALGRFEPHVHTVLAFARQMCSNAYQWLYPDTEAISRNPILHLCFERYRTAYSTHFRFF
jgi:hypothetical protein